MNNYLTEELLGDYLIKIFPAHKFIRNKKVPNSNIGNRPDFRNEDLMLIIEFDGYGHYNQPDNILIDYHKDNIYSDMGYHVVRIPYFIQMSKEIINLLFEKDIDIEQTYPHGFIDRNSMLPSFFCELGVIRFKKDLKEFEIVKEDIIKSLNDKYEEYVNINFVLPPSLHDLLIQ